MNRREGDPPPPSQKLGDGMGGPCPTWRTCTLTITMLQTGLLLPRPEMKFQYTGQAGRTDAAFIFLAANTAAGRCRAAWRLETGFVGTTVLSFAKYLRWPSPRLSSPVSAPIRSVVRNTLIAVCHGCFGGRSGWTASRLHPFDTGLS